MIRVGILGTGNVATHLCRFFTMIADVEIVQVAGRNETDLQDFGIEIPTTSDFTKIMDADMYIIAVKDDAIAKISEYLKEKKGLIVHTSGSISIDVLSDHDRFGVFYPLQTFSKVRKVDMNSVPFCLESHDEADMALLKKLAASLSEKVYEVNSEQRKSLHLAAVFVNNFSNHLYHIGQTICKEKELPFKILLPLIQETAAKIEQLAPYEAQTGPARRGDSETIEKQVEQLKESIHRDVYEVLSQSIGNLYFNLKPR